MPIFLEELMCMCFNGYRCTVLKDVQRGILSAYPFGRSCSVAAVARDIVAHPGHYEIIVRVRSRYPVYWFGTYAGARRIYLHNGLNKINIEITPGQMQFIVGLFSTRVQPRDGIMIYRVVARCVEAHAPNPVLMLLARAQLTLAPASATAPAPVAKIQPEPTNNSVIASLPASNSIISIPVSTVPYPRVIFVVSARGTRADSIALAAHQLYASTHNTAIEYVTDKPKYQNYTPSDIKLVIKFGLSLDTPDPFVLFPSAIKATYIDGASKSQISVSDSDLAQSSCILYSSPQVKRLLDEQYTHIVHGKQIAPAFGGADLSIFSYAQPLDIKPKLVVGWIGDCGPASIVHTKLTLVLGSIPWIDLRVISPLSVINPLLRRDFYQSIDILISIDANAHTIDGLLEAMACGRPWISMRTGMAEHIQSLSPEPVCIVIDNFAQIVPQLIQFRTERPLLHQMGIRAAHLAHGYFSWGQQLGGLKALLERATASM